MIALRALWITTPQGAMIYSRCVVSQSHPRCLSLHLSPDAFPLSSCASARLSVPTWRSPRIANWLKLRRVQALCRRETHCIPNLIHYSRSFSHSCRHCDCPSRLGGPQPGVHHWEGCTLARCHHQKGIRTRDGAKEEHSTTVNCDCVAQRSLLRLSHPRSIARPQRPSRPAHSYARSHNDP